MSTQQASGTTTGSSGSTAGMPTYASAVQPQQPAMNWQAPPNMSAGVGSLPSAGYYMNNNSNYYMSQFGQAPQQDMITRRYWAPTAWQPSTQENMNTAAGWQAPIVPAPGSNPILAARANERAARAAAEQQAKASAAAAAAAAPVPAFNPYDPYGLAPKSPTGVSASPYGGVMDANGNRIY